MGERLVKRPTVPLPPSKDATVLNARLTRAKVRLENKRLAALEQETIRTRTVLYQQQGIVRALEKAVGFLRGKPENGNPPKR
jgi:hypothetical protein